MHHIMGLGSLLEFKLCYKAGLSEFLRAYLQLFLRHAL
jgi:hypothetical protein